MPWDGEAMRRQLDSAAEKLERYPLEHLDRLLRKQPNGSRLTHDQVHGERWVCYRMAGLAATETREGLIAELEKLQGDLPTSDGAFDQPAFRTGVQLRIRGLLAQAQRKLD